MKLTHAINILICISFNIVRFSKEYSFEIESQYLYELDRGCESTDIRFDVEYFVQLEFCKTVHGFVRISDIFIETTKYNLNSFVELREITGYLLISNISGIKSLSELFPNLQVIRGQYLHHGFALLITDMPDLENIGLKSLTYIENGNVWVENNEKLLFINTINWEFLRKGIEVINRNNKNLSSFNKCKVSEYCWSPEIPQQICNNLVEEDENESNECTICNKFILLNGNETKCTSYEPLTFKLENRFLVNAEMCEKIGRTRLDDVCLKIDECPVDEYHFYSSIENACLYSPEKIKKCTIIIKSLEDLKNFKDIDCNISDKLEISDLEENIEENVQKLIDKKFENLVEIKTCLIIKNSSAVTSLNFLKKLRTINGECNEDHEKFSVKIVDNKNLQTFIPNKFKSKIRVNRSVILRNNENLCYDQMNSALSLFEILNGILNVTDKCAYGKMEIQTFATKDSALIMLDGVKVEGYKILLNLWKVGKRITIEMQSMHLEVTGLQPMQKYPFKIELMNSNGDKIFSSSYHFIEAFNVLSNIDAISYENKIDIEIKDIERVKEFNRNMYVYYINYNSSFYENCIETMEEISETKEYLSGNVLPFQKYVYIMRPLSISIQNESESSIRNIFPFNSKVLPIHGLLSNKCYEIKIFLCKIRKTLFCYMPKVITIKTKKNTKTANKEKVLEDSIEKIKTSELNENNETYVVIFLIAIVIVPILSFYSYKIYLKKRQHSLQNSQIDLTPIFDKYEINRENIVIKKEIGKGEFGIVYMGFINSNKNTLYAIKTLAESNQHYQDSFIREAQLMKKFDAHHVVKLIGYCTKEKPLMVVMEMMIHGDLKKFLHKNRPIDILQKSLNSNASSSYTTAPMSNKTLHPIRSVPEMAIEIADGMMYLEHNKFIHCDLACRNCMVHESYTIKIGDFGMARELYYSDYYKPEMRNKRIPLRWMPPEALGVEPKYTSKSDVFSFGIVLYELVTYCEKPYLLYSDDQVIQMIKSGIKMEKPKDCEDKIYQLMLSCWRYNPDERITFKEIIEFLLNNFKIQNFVKVSFYHNSR